MAKGIYIGVDSKARKVKKAYIGVDNKARKVKKGYIGVGGVARLFYSSETLVPFTTCPFPNFTDFTATNDYGTWTSSASSTYGSSNRAYNAFDTDTNTFWRSNAIGTISGRASVQLDFPTGISIMPSTITVKYRCCGSGSCVQGYNPDTSEWVDISTLNPVAGTFSTVNLTYSGDVYFSAIRFDGPRYSSSYTTPTVAELKITSGIIKVE